MAANPSFDAAPASAGATSGKQDKNPSTPKGGFLFLAELCYNVKMAKRKIPKELWPLFWSYHASSLDPRRNKELIIINVVNYGNWAHWRWLVRMYGREEIKKIIREISISEFRYEALVLFSLLLKLSLKEFKYTTRSEKITQLRRNEAMLQD